MKNGASKGKIAAASVIGCILTLQLGAFSVTIETLLSGVTELPFTAFVGLMQPIHLAIGLVEGLITAAVLIFVYEARPELLWGCAVEKNKQAKLSKGATIAILTGITAVTGGVLSLFASAFPDGLEWAIEHIAGTTDLPAAGAQAAAQSIQEKTSFLPDYAFSGSDSVLGTSVSGIVGALIVAGFCVLIAFVIRTLRKRTS